MATRVEISFDEDGNVTSGDASLISSNSYDFGSSSYKVQFNPGLAISNAKAYFPPPTGLTASYQTNAIAVNYSSSGAATTGPEFTLALWSDVAVSYGNMANKAPWTLVSDVD